MIILSINAGSSSLKVCCYEMTALNPLSHDARILFRGSIERLNTPDASIRYTREDSQKTSRGLAGATHEAALGVILEELGRTPDAVAHRVVHGGPDFSTPVEITPSVLSTLQTLSEYAPLHNPPAIACINEMHKTVPTARNSASFDTAFHHSMPDVAKLYAIPPALTKNQTVRKYGFHGISYEYLTEKYLDITGNSSDNSRLILCHLGAGASCCAVLNGRSIDTSMGFTPLDGLIMATRCGEIDPGVILALLMDGVISASKLEDTLNHESGLLALSGKSGDVRDLETAEAAGDSRATLALEAFAYRVRKTVGSYVAALGGVDALILSGGVGENSSSMRNRICKGMEAFGIELDSEKNRDVNVNTTKGIQSDRSRVAIYALHTDEERQIARDAWKLFNK